MVNLLLQVCQRREKKVHKRNPSLELNSVWLEQYRGGGMVRLAKATAAVVLDQTLMYIAGQTCFRIVIVNVADVLE